MASTWRPGSVTSTSRLPWRTKISMPSSASSWRTCLDTPGCDVNRAFLALKGFGEDQFEIVAPSLSILAEPPVTVVDRTVDKEGTREVATAYLEFPYSPQGQELAGKHFNRPTDPEVAARYQDQFIQVDLVTIGDLRGWKTAQEKHFSNGGIFDQIYTRRD